MTLPTVTPSKNGKRERLRVVLGTLPVKGENQRDVALEKHDLMYNIICEVLPFQREGEPASQTPLCTWR